MDAPTQSIIVVIANPIAGNPSQFALERALKSMDLDWRVVSFDVAPEDVPAALEGFAVTGIAGVLIDPSLQQEVATWYRDSPDHDDSPDHEHTERELQTIDCLFRGDDGKFVGINQQRDWLKDRIEQVAIEDPEVAERIWLGESLDESVVTVEQFPAEATAVPANVEILKNAKWIALTDGPNGPVELEVDDWPENDGSTNVIDLCGGDFMAGHPDLKRISDLGYHTINCCDRKIGMLQKCLNQWTGSEPSSEVLQDAIEEYLGV